MLGEAGHAFLEIGYTNQVTIGAGADDQVVYPQALLRIGLPARFELDIVPPGLVTQLAAGVPPARVSGSSDAGLGFQYQIGYSSRAVIGVNTLVSLPTGSPAFTAGGPGYTFNINASYSASPNIGLASTLGFSSLAGANSTGKIARFSTVSPSIVVTDALPAGFQGFAEIAGTTTSGPGAGPNYLIDYGLQRPIGSRAVVDVEVGNSLTTTGGSHSHYFGFGGGIAF